jgi:hypothetical protein
MKAGTNYRFDITFILSFFCKNLHIMKKTSLLFVALALVHAGIAQIATPANEIFPQQDYITKNKIKNELIYDYKISAKSIVDSSLAVSILYDEKGNCLGKYLSASPENEEVVYYYSYNYSDNGKLLKQTEYNNNRDILSTTDFKYDSSANEISSYTTNKDESEMCLTQKKYNRNNDLIQVISETSDKDGIYSYYNHRYYYNENHQLVKDEKLNAKGEVMSTDLVEYDMALNKKIIYEGSKRKKEMKGEYFFNASQQCKRATEIVNEMKLTSSNNFDWSSLDKTQHNYIYYSPEESIKLYGSTSIYRRDLNSNEGIKENMNPSRTYENISYNLTRENIFNSDGTIFEVDIYLDGKKIKMNRYYYSK